MGVGTAPKAAAVAQDARRTAVAPAPPQLALARKSCECGAEAGLSGRCAPCSGTSLASARPRPSGFPGHAAEPVVPMRAPQPSVAAAHNIAQMNLRAATQPPTAIHVQTQLRVSTPGDSAEREAQDIGRRIAAMPAPTGTPPDNLVPMRRGFAGTVQRRAIGPAVASPAVTSGIEATRGAGAPLPRGVRAFMEPRFGADFSGVRVHRGPQAATMSNALNAHAFTVGRDIYFNNGQFKPETHAGRELIAHELAHTIQQGGVIQRAAAETTVSERTGTGVQRGLWDSIKGAASDVAGAVVDAGKSLLSAIADPLNWLADKANMIPGFRLLTIVLGVNPINMTPVAATPENVLMGLVELIPGGGLVTQALKNANIFDKVAGWFKQKVAEADRYRKLDQERGLDLRRHPFAGRISPIPARCGRTRRRSSPLPIIRSSPSARA